MAETAASNGNAGAVQEHDAVIVGASLAGCAAAIFLGRAGASVALVDQRTAQGRARRDERFTGGLVRARSGELTERRAKLVVGADGRDSRVAKLSGVRRRTYPHGRFAYGGYFEGPQPPGWPGASLWFLNP